MTWGRHGDEVGDDVETTGTTWGGDHGDNGDYGDHSHGDHMGTFWGYGDDVRMMGTTRG